MSAHESSQGRTGFVLGELSAKLDEIVLDFHDPRFEGRLIEKIEQSVRARLRQRFAGEWEAGSSMTLEEAVALARTKE